MTDVPERTPSLTRSLARLIRSRTASDEDLLFAEQYVRDWMGSMVAGQATDPGRSLLAYGRNARGGGAGWRAVQDVETVTFLAAALSHITETDDLHRGSVTHPACVVVPVSLVLGRNSGTDGHAVLRAVLAGYEAMLRVGEALGPGHYRMFHNTATAGVFGSAAAAATILDLDEDGWVWAFGNAGTQAAGLWQFNEDATMTKHLHAGHAAVAGLRAALLAEHGFTGAEAILEGDRGFFRALCPDPDPEAVLRTSTGWKLPETSLKPYPCCRHTHPAVDAALEIRTESVPSRAEDARDGRIESIEITTYEAARRLTDNSAPEVPYAAKFSIQYCVATALTRGVPDLPTFEPPHLHDPGVRTLLGRSAVRVSPALDAAYPDRWGVVVRVTWSDGQVSESTRTDARGDPEFPLSDAEIDQKVRSLFQFGGLEDAEGRALLEQLRRLVHDGPAPRLPGIPAPTPEP